MKCKSCGAEIQFDAKTQKLKCKYCGSEFDPKEYNEKEKVAKEVKEIENEAKTYMCKQCGAKLLTFDDTAITFCSYCGSSMVIESDLYKGEYPAYVIPFKVTQEEVEKIYKKKIKSMWFAPKEMKSDVVIKKFRGIYMPYAVYKATHEGLQINHGEKYHHSSGDYSYYSEYDISCDINAEYEGMSYDLSSNFYDKFSQAISPFDFNEAKEFDIDYLAGFYADSRDVDMKLYEEEVRKLIAPSATRELRKVRGFAKYGCSSPKVTFTVSDTKLAYYPVYFLAIRNKKNDTINYAVVNGQTGEIAVELPVDYKKYLLFSILSSAIIFIFLNTFLTLTPKRLITASLVLAIINLIIVLSQQASINRQKHHEDDKGFKSTHTEKVKKEKTNKLTILCLVGSILLCLLYLASSFVNDYHYYAAAIVSLTLTLSTFKNVIKQFNALTSRKLSQLGIRGGDESEM